MADGVARPRSTTRDADRANAVAPCRPSSLHASRRSSRSFPTRLLAVRHLRRPLLWKHRRSGRLSWDRPTHWQTRATDTWSHVGVTGLAVEGGEGARRIPQRPPAPGRGGTAPQQAPRGSRRPAAAARQTRQQPLVPSSSQLRHTRDFCSHGPLSARSRVSPSSSGVGGRRQVRPAVQSLFDSLRLGYCCMRL